MICMFLGSQGSGKSASAVREMMINSEYKTFFSNIITQKVKNNILIQSDMIIKKTPVLKNDGNLVMKEGEPIMKLTVNKDFWISASKKYNGLNIVIDEAHTILNARRAMTKKSQVILDWIAMLRRVVGSTSSGYGRLYLITQIERRLDIVAKEQATEARYHLCHYRKTCPNCGLSFMENNEVPEPVEICPGCETRMIKHQHFIEVWHFQDYGSFINWKYLGKGHTYYKHYYILDIEKVFPYYNTMQWENLITEI